MELKLKDLNLEFKSQEMYGVIDECHVLKKQLEISKEIGYIYHKNYLTKTVSDEFYLVKKKIANVDNYIEKIISSLNMIGLSEDYLEREIVTLSKTEKILLEIAVNLITNPDVIILDNVLSNLDRKHKLIIKQILLELKKKYDKTIIIIDDNINILYEFCTYLIVFKDRDLLVNDKMSNVFLNTSYLIDNNIEIPEIIKFSLIADQYGKKIKFHNNVNDLIKDVYKNAR